MKSASVAMGFLSRTTGLAVWLVVVGLAGQAQEAPKPAAPESTAAATTAAKPPWGRIVVVGASASAGFTESEPFGGPNTPQYRLSRYLDAALRVPHEPVRNLATTMFFLQPEAEGRKQIDQALRVGPTLVVGLDFLFWFCYGDGRTDAERLGRFEQGLKMLETLQCPLVIGDIPDASAAANRVLTPEEMPSAEAMSAANRRLKEWAASRKQVSVLPLARFMRMVMADQPLTIRGYTLPEGKTRLLLQSDKLHPSASGCAFLALTVLDTFLSNRPILSAGEVRWDPEEVLRLGSNCLELTPNNPPKPR